jgi:tetratricopeptide (TPR) repeat protein
MGCLDEALSEGMKARDLDPLSIIINRDLGLLFSYAGQPDKAIEQFAKTLEIDPDFALTHQGLGRAYLQKGMNHEAVEQMEKAMRLAPDSPAMMGALAHVYGVTGQLEKAGNLHARLLELAKTRYVPGTTIAVAYLGLGDHSRSLDWLEKAAEERDDGLLLLRVHPIYNPLRSEKRFESILRRMNLLA